jgi:CubicO group peptidase (beta-lactamase class C family)
MDPTPFTGHPPEYEPARAFPGASAALPDDDGSAADAGPPYGTPEELAQKVDAYVAGYGKQWGDAFKPSGVVIVAKDGTPVLSRMYGFANREKSTPFTLDTQLRIGSLTKQFVAAATLKLVEGQSLALKDSVRKYLPELPAAFEAVTLHHLLSQTSGIPSYTDDAKLLARKKDEVPQGEVVGWASKKTLDFTPGEKHVYSNTNYFLLGVVLERVTKKPLPEVLAKEIFAPAGLKSTAPDPNATAAIGYVRGASAALGPADVVSNSLPGGAGFLRSSARDLLAWDRALASDKVLKKESRELLFKPVSQNYAYGWVYGQLGGTEIAWHNGKIDGFGSFFARAPEKGIAVVVLSNSFDFDETTLGNNVLTMALTDKAIPPLVERPLAPIDEAYAKTVTGEYVIPKKSLEELKQKLPAAFLDTIEGFELKYGPGGLMGRASGQNAFPLMRSAEGALFFQNAGIEITPDFGDPKKPEKKAKGIKLAQGALTIDYVRGKMPAPKKAAPAKPEPKKAEPKKEPTPEPKKGGTGDGSGSGKGTGGGGGKGAGKGTGQDKK